MRMNQNQKSLPDVIRNYNLCRNNLLLAIIMTAVNIVLYVAGSSTYFLFSISFPYYFFNFSDPVGSVFAVLVLATYVALYLLSKKKPVCMIPALVLFCLDVGVLGFSFLGNLGFAEEAGVLEEAAGSILLNFLIDLAFHVWVLVYLIKGVAMRKKYEYAVEHANDPEPVADEGETSDTTDEF